MHPISKSSLQCPTSSSNARKTMQVFAHQPYADECSYRPRYIADLSKTGHSRSLLFVHRSLNALWFFRGNVTPQGKNSCVKLLVAVCQQTQWSNQRQQRLSLSRSRDSGNSLASGLRLPQKFRSVASARACGPVLPRVLCERLLRACECSRRRFHSRPDTVCHPFHRERMNNLPSDEMLNSAELCFRSTRNPH